MEQTNRLLLKTAVLYALLPLCPWVRRKLLPAAYRPAGLLQKAQSGGMLAALNAILFLLPLAICLAVDFGLLRPWAAISMPLFFDCTIDKWYRALLKAAFLLICAMLGGSCTITALLMITFENLVWEEDPT